MGGCDLLHKCVWDLPRFREGEWLSAVPSNGIYFLFETGECAHGGERIVGIGSHTGQNNLPKRISEHMCVSNKDRSILRKHVGRCLLQRENDPFVRQWDIDLTTKASREKYAHSIDLDRQAEIEHEVSAYMSQHFSFCVIRVDAKLERMVYEKRLISTLCSCADCAPSSGWLGRWHSNQRIALSGLWNIHGQNGTALSEGEIAVLFGVD